LQAGDIKTMIEFGSMSKRQELGKFIDDVHTALNNNLGLFPDCPKESVQKMTEWLAGLIKKVEDLKVETNRLLLPCVELLKFVVNASPTQDILYQEQARTSADAIECEAACQSKHLSLCSEFKTLVLNLYAATGIRQLGTPGQKAQFCHVWQVAHHVLFEALQVKDQETLLSPQDLE
jgi:hypothetical protein